MRDEFKAPKYAHIRNSPLHFAVTRGNLLFADVCAGRIANIYVWRLADGEKEAAELRGREKLVRNSYRPDVFTAQNGVTEDEWLKCNFTQITTFE